MKRSHDEFYLLENNQTVKQSFVEVADEIELQGFHSIADVGCATGAFPNYLKLRFPSVEVIGIEYLQSLLSKARKDFPHIEFNNGNVLDQTSVTRKFDVITMLGVLCIFDDYRLVIQNALSWLNPGGRLILHNMVSEFDIDVIIKYKKSSLDVEYSNYESGWNVISEKSLSLVADANGAELISSKPFQLKVDLARTDDVMRSWTEKNIQGNKEVFNALHIRQPQRIVTIKKM
jgi:trans-aconitate methyltransferase